MSLVNNLEGGLRLATLLHKPEPAPSKSPGVIIVHPGGAVKEHTANLFAERLSQQGFVSVAFHALYQGQSEGLPQFLKDLSSRVSDVSAAVDYLQNLAFVNPDDIAVLRPLAIETEDFKPDWDAIDAEYKAALIRTAQDPALVKRLDTKSASNVGYAQAAYAAGAAAISQLKSLTNWNEGRERFTQFTTEIMLKQNPNPNEAVAAICYNQGYDCFYMGRNNDFWSQGDGGTINLYTRWYRGACRFDDQSDLHC
ncbi:x-pro dipeptidyl-peptidase (s15 family) protein [Colletotrichum incanum]|nr:x-pro dipeptidyl-peptidase (s15 family) protein [Colletotrichum incanum]